MPAARITLRPPPLPPRTLDLIPQSQSPRVAWPPPHLLGSSAPRLSPPPPPPPSVTRLRFPLISGCRTRRIAFLCPLPLLLRPQDPNPNPNPRLGASSPPRLSPPQDLAFSAAGESPPIPPHLRRVEVHVGLTASPPRLLIASPSFVLFLSSSPSPVRQYSSPPHARTACRRRPSRLSPASGSRCAGNLLTLTLIPRSRSRVRVLES
jgi:hypothetical protein